MIHIWRGFHHQELPSLLKTSWNKNELVILIPQHLKDFSIFKKMAASEILFHGDWSEDLKKKCLENSLQGPEALTHEELKSKVLGVFTSGTSTGMNRLIFYSRENVESSLASIRELFDVKRLKKIFCYPQPTHTFGLVLGYMQSILFNLELRFAEGPYSRASHEQWLTEHDENTLTLGAPAHFTDLLKHLKNQKIKPRNSYSAIVGGARVSVGLWDSMQTELHIEAPSVGYGATEASPGVTHLPPGVRPSEDGDIGYALKNVEIQLTEGGLEFKGPNVCALIFQNNDFKKVQKMTLHDSVVASTSTLSETKGLRYTYLGRTDLMINRGGIKISLEHAESILSEYLKTPVLALSLFHERLGDDLGFIVQANENEHSKQSVQTPDTEKIQEFIKKEFGFKIEADSILISQIPLNPNGKGDRLTGIKLLLKKKQWTFPVKVEHLRNLLPHKGPAIWVDSILELDEKFAVGSVNLKQNRPYFSQEKESIVLRETACIEWVAQAYGYATALGDILGVRKADIALKTFIAEVKSAEFYFNDHRASLLEGESIQIKVHCPHDFGNLKVVEGQVTHRSNLLATISMKVYCG